MAAVVTLVAPRTGVASEADFPVPAGLAPAVRLWTDVFARHGQRDVVIHDRLEPGLVYEVVSDADPGDPARIRARVEAVADRLALARLHQPEARMLFAMRPVAVEPLARIRTQRGLRESFQQGLLAERLFRRVVRAALAAEGLPSGLAALPLLESSYHPGLTSHAGAVGLWQITPAAARDLGLAGHDERRDPARSSVAAARRLRELHEQFDDWPLAITAYNRGATGVERARRTVGSDDLGAIVRGYDGPGFGFASRNYYAEFLAARQVMRHAAEYFPELPRARVVAYRVKRGDTLSRVARRHGVSVPSLRVTNGIRSAALRPGQMLLIRL